MFLEDICYIIIRKYDIDTLLGQLSSTQSTSLLGIGHVKIDGEYNTKTNHDPTPQSESSSTFVQGTTLELRVTVNDP